jgi:hypothetical protein
MHNPKSAKTESPETQAQKDYILTWEEHV